MGEEELTEAEVLREGLNGFFWLRCLGAGALTGV